jgi:hypothetical protein
VSYDKIDATETNVITIVENLFETKKPIHFRYYQSQAEGWSTIVKRRP